MHIFDGFIAAVAEELKIKFHKKESGIYTTKIEFEDNRSHEVLITLAKDESGDRMIHYYSMIAHLKMDDGELFKYVLQSNAGIDYGAIALLDDNLILKNSILLEDCEPKRFLKSLVYIAAKADELEELLVKKKFR